MTEQRLVRDPVTGFYTQVPDAPPEPPMKKEVATTETSRVQCGKKKDVPKGA